MKKLILSLLMLSGLAFGQTKVNLQTQVQGVLPVANGGTGSSSGPSAALSSITAATNGSTIASGDNAQVWQWSLTTASKSAFKFGESAASTNGTNAQFLVDIGTLANSTAFPFRVSARGTDVFYVGSGGDIHILTPSSTQAQPINITSGNSTNNVGGAINITSGNGTANNIRGGPINITSGDGDQNNGDASNGGNITILTGKGNVSGRASGQLFLQTSGANQGAGAECIYIQPGTGNGGKFCTNTIFVNQDISSYSEGNSITVRGYDATASDPSTAPGGALILRGGSTTFTNQFGGDVTISGGATSGGVGGGGNITISTGNGGATSGNSGTVNISTGSVTSGSIGSINLKPNGTTKLTADSTGITITQATLLISPTAPTISSGFGSSPTIGSNNGTATFRVNVGTGGTASSGVIGLPTASNGWNCFVDLFNPNSTAILSRTIMSASSVSSVTVQNELISTGAATAWQASQVLILICMAY